MADEIIQELWRVKDDIAREHKYDLEALITHLRDVGSRTGRVAVDLSAARGEAGRRNAGKYLPRDGKQDAVSREHAAREDEEEYRP